MAGSGEAAGEGAIPPEHPSPTTPPAIGITAGRIVLLLVAMAAMATAIISASPGDRDNRDPAAATFVCPMHPQVRSASPGECPLCKMVLEPAATTTPAAASMLSRSLSSRRPDLAHPAIDRVRRVDLTTAFHAPAFSRDGDGVVALLYQDELAALSPGERGRFTASRRVTPAAPIDVRLAPEAPEIRDDETAWVRFRVDPPLREVAAGTAGWVDLPPRSRRMLVVPSQAVIESAQGPSLLIASTDWQTFARRQVLLGTAFSTFVVVRAGVREGERIPVKDTFFIDAELRARAALAPAARGTP